MESSSSPDSIRSAAKRCPNRRAPGRSDALHAHADAEEHLYVLRGEFECGDVTYKAGDYLFRPAGVPHQTSSRTGAETLLVYVKRKDGA
jgi:quercetin dioxygenase-like cupin family protein